MFHLLSMFERLNEDNIYLLILYDFIFVVSKSNNEDALKIKQKV